MEMVSDKGIQYNNEKTLHMLHIDEGENPVSIQLFGSDEDSLARAAEIHPRKHQDRYRRYQHGLSS